MQAPAISETQRPKLLARFGERFGVDPTSLLDTLKQTAFQSKDQISNEQMMSLLVVADQHGLNPFTKEIYAFPDKGRIVPVVGVDGWYRIANEHPMLDGYKFNMADIEVESTDGSKHDSCPAWIECVMYRKDRAHAISVRERLSSCYRKPFKESMPGPWQTHTERMLRHKAFIQCARAAFGFSGIYDKDEADDILANSQPAEARTIRDITPKRKTVDVATLTAPIEKSVEEPAATYAQIADMIQNASSADESNAAVAMSEHLEHDQRSELVALHLSRWATAQ